MIGKERICSVMKTTLHTAIFLVLAFAVASGHATFSQGESTRMEARELANRMLAGESVLPVLDLGERDMLATKIQGILKKIRARFPAMSTIRARMRHNPRTLIVQTTPAFMDTITKALDANPGTQPPRTGDADFDTLNTYLRLDRVVALEYTGHLLLYFSDDLDIEAAIIAYTALESVQDVAPDHLLGDGPDVYITYKNNRWFVTFREAWGDCPSGCIHSQLHRFIIENNTLRKLTDTGT